MLYKDTKMKQMGNGIDYGQAVGQNKDGIDTQTIMNRQVYFDKAFDANYPIVITTTMMCPANATAAHVANITSYDANSFNMRCRHVAASSSNTAEGNVMWYACGWSVKV